jgi:hypothetical protein
MHEIAPKTISKILEDTVGKFFNQVENQIRTVEQQVLNKIDGSSNLKELESLLNQHKGSFGMEHDQNYEKHK